MTLEELSQHFRLLERLDRDKEILENLRSAAVPGAQVLTGMPHAPGVRDRVGDLAAEIADMETQIKGLEDQIAENGKKVEEFISTMRRTRAWRSGARSATPPRLRSSPARPRTSG